MSFTLIAFQMSLSWNRPLILFYKYTAEKKPRVILIISILKGNFSKIASRIVSIRDFVFSLHTICINFVAQNVIHLFTFSRCSQYTILWCTWCLCPKSFSCVQSRVALLPLTSTSTPSPIIASVWRYHIRTNLITSLSCLSVAQGEWERDTYSSGNNECQAIRRFLPLWKKH